VADVLTPTSVADAISMLGAHPGAHLVAGGTDVMLDLRTGRSHADSLIDLSRLSSQLSGIRAEGGRWRIGAMTTIRALEDDRELARQAPAIGEAATVLGSPQIRTMATIGGNLAHGTPSAEMPPPLLVHDASVELVGADGTRTIPLADLFVGPGRTSMRRPEILTAVVCDATDGGCGSVYLRQTVRWAMDLAGVGVAASVRVVDGRIETARIALGAVHPVPLLVPLASAVVVGHSYDPGLAREAGRLAAEACTPITDARGSSDYRRRVVAALVPRALRIAWLRATGQFTADRAPINGVLNEEGR